jgi:hypothetical protein
MQSTLSASKYALTALRSFAPAEAVVALLDSCGPDPSVDIFCRAFERLLGMPQGDRASLALEKVSQVAMRQAAGLSGQVDLLPQVLAKDVIAQRCACANTIKCERLHAVLKDRTGV